MKTILGHILIVALLAVTGCSSQSKAVPASTSIAATVVAEISATAQLAALRTSVAGTVVAQAAPAAVPSVTVTPPPGPSGTPKVAATPSQVAPPPKPVLPTFDAKLVIPDTWQTYKDPDERFSLRYPEDWRLTSAKDNNLTFQASTFNLAMLSIMETTLPFEGRDLIDEVERSGKLVLGVPFETTSKGQWPGTIEGVYLSGVMTDPRTRLPADLVILYARTSGGDVFAAFLGMTGIGSVERFSLDHLIGSIRYGNAPPAGSPKASRNVNT